MTYDFDEVIDRRNTLSIKHDFKKEYNVPEEALAMWVADMDFRPPREVHEALNKVIEHGIFGYSEVNEEYFEVLKAWVEKHYHYEIEKGWIIKCPTVVFALYTAVQAYTEPGDPVLILRPVYGPFTRCITETGRRLVTSTMHYVEDHYEIDFEDMEAKIKEENIHLFILCNPHNPGGRVWTREELLKMEDICRRNDVLVVSDEIHADFVYGDREFTSYATLSEEAREHVVLCTAPSKTFNIAGLQISNIFIPNEDLRRKFKKAHSASGYGGTGLMGIVAAKAAYEFGEPWMQEMKEYVYGNQQYVKAYMEQHVPKIKVMRPEGTYLMWLDFNAYGLEQDELMRKLKEDALVWLNSGLDFGEEGKGFARLNVACSRSVVEEACRRIEKAFA